MTRIVISSGHGRYVRGAAGFLDEVLEARRVVTQTAKLLHDAGAGVVTFHDDMSTSQNENLKRIVAFHNTQKRDLDVSVHFNAYVETDKPMGTEVLYVSAERLAEEVAAAIATAGALTDRGAKYRDDLYFLNNTECPAILIEVCFVDSATDAEHYQKHFLDICRAIARCVAGPAAPGDAATV